MSTIEPQDIAKWESNKMKNKTWKTEKIEAISYDENGEEEETWKGYAVIKTDDPINYCFQCRNEDNADELCEFLNNNYHDVSLHLDEWEKILGELETDEKDLITLKEHYQKRESEIIQNVDFKTLYGANNEKIRKAHVKKTLKDTLEKKQSLELKIDANKRKVSFLKASVYAGIELMRLH